MASSVLRRRLLGATAVSGAALWALQSRKLANEGPAADVASVPAPAPPAKPAPVNWDAPTLVWGSNKNKLISPDAPSSESLRTPSASDLALPPLRDLALHAAHGALVDARGDVYQWGDAHFGDTSRDNREPMPTLTGKDITSVALSGRKLYALSKSGRVFVLPVAAGEHPPQQATSGSSWFSWLWGGKSENAPHVELATDSKLAYRETFTSISAGSAHLLALTSAGRVFAHPISLAANAYGQLGFRKVDVPAADPKQPRVELTLNAKEPAAAPEGIDDDSIRFCDKLFDVPALSEVKAAQVVAGDRSSFVRTAQEGRVLAWGANEYGQLGLGTATTLPYVTVPSEVVTSRYCPIGTYSKCLSIVAGGDLTFFVVERSSPGKQRSIDVLAAGRGQWGALGNGVFSSAQADPLRIRAVSGLTEYSETLKKTVPMDVHALSVSPAPSGHVLLTLGARSEGAVARDLLSWGLNQSGQLGNGARKNIAVPAPLEDGSGQRALLGERTMAVRDMQGAVWRKKARVQQTVVAGHECSVAYWKIVDP
ncbi:RCC1/BLIP-II [Auricularia subglabra TFB-10046 SS5]|nr:RCC1/BLIP-II [Auricularia subglabra TFB-10046 SS5]